MVLDLFEESSIFGEDKVDRSSLSAESASAANSVNVVLLLHRKLVVDDKTNLLHIDTSSEQVCRDQDSYGSRSELLHYDFTLLLVHLSVHAGDHEVLSRHQLLEFVDSALCVAVNNSLLDVQVRVKVQQYIDFPLMLLDGDVVLVDTFKGKVFLLHEDLGGRSHKVLR